MPVRRLAASLLASLSETQATQGVVALARPPVSDEESLFTGTPLVVVADALQDPGNLGGLLRTAEAAGASGAYLTAGCADPFSWKALRGSMGSALRLPLVRGLDTAAVLERLEASGDPGLRHLDRRRHPLRRGATSPVPRPSSSAARAPDCLRTCADGRPGGCGFPSRPGVESLNVGVAAGLVLFEAARQRGFAFGDGGG